jgi:succinate dehydrogenase / fumarate reductase membrane anchor subunit
MKLKWENNGIKTPLARAKGLGSAGGVEHWWHQRVTAIALIPLSIWFVYSIVDLAGANYMTFTLWLASPLNAVLMILFIIASFYHAWLGVQVIVEDYVHNEFYKLSQLLIFKLAFFGLAVASIFSVLKIAFTAG